MSVFEAQLARQGGKSRAPSDVERVLNTPRVLNYAAPNLVRKHGAPGHTLRPVQVQALAAIEFAQGGLFPVGVGHGKSIIALLTGAVLKTDLAIVCVSPQTVPQMVRELVTLREHYEIPETLVWSWAGLSAGKHRADLAALDPTGQRVVFVADEAHCLRHQTAARTKRVQHWLQEHTQVMFVALSGTLCSRRISDYAHLADWALRDRTPVPRGEAGRQWDRVLSGEPTEPGDKAACVPLAQWAGWQLSNSWKLGQPAPEADLALLRSAWADRLRTTAGVVATAGQSCSASLYIEGYTDQRLAKVKWERAEEIARTFRDPAGNEMADAGEAAEAAKRLALGYWYQWQWPEEPDLEWLTVRNLWNSTVRRFLAGPYRLGVDTPALVAAFAASEYAAGRTAGLVQAWLRWQAVKDRVAPTTKTVWADAAPLDCVAAKARSLDAACLVWYDEIAVAEGLAARGLNVRRAGEAPLGGGIQCLSIRAHGSGLNLQAYKYNVFACAPSSPTAWEQILGRSHRQGQQNDEVWAWVPRWSRFLTQPLEKARKDALFVQATSGEQKLTVACFV